jgi:hypothetical protein
MKRAIPAAIVAACLSHPAGAQAPLPVFGSQTVVGWKSFQPLSGPFINPATPGVYRWWNTGVPYDPTFYKQQDNTGLDCLGMFDVWMLAGEPGDVIMFNIAGPGGAFVRH